MKEDIMEDIEKKLKELQETVANLRETLDARDSSKREEEADKLVNKVIDKMTPKKRQMQWAIPDEKGQIPENGIYLGQFLKAITPGMGARTSNEVMEHVKTTLNEATGSEGGYLVPTEYSNQIIMLESQEAIIRRIGRLFPMSTLVRYLPKQLTDVSVYWIEEGAEKTETNPTFTRITQTAKKMAAIVKLTDELLEDESVGVDKMIQQLIADAMADEEDRLAFVGDVSGLSDPFNGVAYAAGVNSVTTAGANVAGDDIIDLIMSLNAKYRKGATLVTSTDGLKLIMKLKDKNDQYLWAPPTANAPKAIWGYPYEISDEIASTYGTGTQTYILFGNWKKHFFVSDKGGLEVKSSISATDVGSASAFMEDETWFRFKKRISLDVALSVAFSKMLIE